MKLTTITYYTRSTWHWGHWKGH